MRLLAIYIPNRIKTLVFHIQPQGTSNLYTAPSTIPSIQRKSRDHLAGLWQKRDDRRDEGSIQTYTVVNCSANVTQAAKDSSY